MRKIRRKKRINQNASSSTIVERSGRSTSARGLFRLAALLTAQSLKSRRWPTLSRYFE